MIIWADQKNAYPEMTAWVEERFGPQNEAIPPQTYQALWASYSKYRQETVDTDQQ